MSRGLTHYRICIKNCTATDLPSKDSNGYSDPFLCFNFDKYKVCKTEIVKKSLNPKWKFEKEFFYATKFADKLDRKRLEIDCWDWDRFGGNDYIGTVHVDLHTLAHGPIRHDLQLKDGQRNAGRVQFDLEMQEYSTITVHMRGVKLQATNIPKDASLDYEFRGIQKEGKKKQTGRTPKAKQITGSEATYDNSPFYLQATLYEIMTEPILFTVNSKVAKNEFIGATAQFNMSQLLVKKAVKDAPFTLQLSKDGRQLGVITGLFTIENLPRTAQCVGGEHTEDGCTGKLLLDFLPPPSKYLVKLSSGSQPSTGTSTAPQQAASSGGGDGDQIYLEPVFATQTMVHPNASQPVKGTSAGAIPQVGSTPKIIHKPAEPVPPKRAASVSGGSVATDEYIVMPPVQGRVSPQPQRPAVAQHQPQAQPGGGFSSEYTAVDPRSRTPSNPQPVATPTMEDDEAFNEYVSFGPKESNPNSKQAQVATRHLEESIYGTGHRPSDDQAEPEPEQPMPVPQTLEQKAGLPPLPTGWSSAIEPKSGRTFYVDHINKATTWQHPLVEKEKKRASAAPGALTPDSARVARAGSGSKERSRSKSPQPQAQPQQPQAQAQQPQQPAQGQPGANPNLYATNKLDRYQW